MSNSRGRVPVSVVGGNRRLRSSLIAVSVAGAAAMGLVTACDADFRDRECMSNAYPVQAVGLAAGRMCVAKGLEPPAGFVRYPAGQVPQRVDDKWDLYWQDHGLDADGKLIKG